MVDYCLHPETRETRRVLTNGVVVLAIQCQTCGKHVRSASKNGRDMSALPEFDVQILKVKREERMEAGKAQRDEISRQWWADYNAYLETEAWRRVRRAVLARDRICQICFSSTAVQAHHVSYESYKRFGITFPIECAGVCLACHEKLHQYEQDHSTQTDG